MQVNYLKNPRILQIQDVPNIGGRDLHEGIGEINIIMCLIRQALSTSMTGE